MECTCQGVLQHTPSCFSLMCEKQKIKNNLFSQYIPHQRKKLLSLSTREHSMVRKALAKICSGLDEDYMIFQIHLYTDKYRGNLPNSHFTPVLCIYCAGTNRRGSCYVADSRWVPRQSESLGRTVFCSKIWPSRTPDTITTTTWSWGASEA